MPNKIHPMSLKRTAWVLRKWMMNTGFRKPSIATAWQILSTLSKKRKA
jgi:hypothetical protein